MLLTILLIMTKTAKSNIFQHKMIVSSRKGLEMGIASRNARPLKTKTTNIISSNLTIRWKKKEIGTISLQYFTPDKLNTILENQKRYSFNEKHRGSKHRERIIQGWVRVSKDIRQCLSLHKFPFLFWIIPVSLWSEKWGRLG